MALGLLACGAAGAADDEQDWPCIQGLVREVSPSVIWAGPPVADHIESWYADAGTARTVEKLIDRRAGMDQRRAALAEWIASVPEAERADRLTAVFTGVWARLNNRRDQFIDGILRYARHQKAVAGDIQDHLNEVAELKDANDEASIRRLVELEQTLEWEERIFDQREANMVTLCEQPVRVEVELGELARLIAEYLP